MFALGVLLIGMDVWCFDTHSFMHFSTYALNHLPPTYLVGTYLGR